MTERDCFLIAVGIVIGYFGCYVVEIYRHLRDWHQPPQLPEPPPRPEKPDPADWWKECQ